MQAHLARPLSRCLRPLPFLCCGRVGGIASAEMRVGVASLGFAKPGACVPNLAKLKLVLEGRGRGEIGR